MSMQSSDWSRLGATGQACGSQLGYRQDASSPLLAHTSYLSLSSRCKLGELAVLGKPHLAACG